MPARPHPTSPAHAHQPPPYPVYTESPLRNVQLQSDVRIERRRTLRSAPSDSVGRHEYSSAIKTTIYDALGSNEPVDLLPHISKRAATARRKKSDTSLDENLRPPPTEPAATETATTDSAQPPAQETLKVYRSPRNDEWVLDEALYATPSGYEEAPPGSRGLISFILR